VYVYVYVCMYVCMYVYIFMYIYMSPPMNGETVEIRLTIFAPEYTKKHTQIYYSRLADFPSARSRVDGLHIYIHIHIYMYVGICTYIYIYIRGLG
jgi:hypothetical protein